MSALAGIVIVGLIVVVWLAVRTKPKSDKSDSSYKSLNQNVATVKQMLFSDTDLNQDSNILNRAETGQAVENARMLERQANLTSLNNYDDYNSVAQYMAVDPEVYDSHNKYTADMGNSTTGASMMTITDHPNDINPWVARKPFYHDAFVQPGARQEPSEYPDQMRDKVYYVVG